MIVVHQRPAVVLIVVTFACLFIFLASSLSTHELTSALSNTFSSGTTTSTSLPSYIQKHYMDGTSKDHSNPAGTSRGRGTNSSLSFSKIFLVDLSERSDKRDGIALMAAVTGFDVEWVDGVRGETIPDKADLFGMDRHKLMETNLGS